MIRPACLLALVVLTQLSATTCRAEDAPGMASGTNVHVIKAPVYTYQQYNFRCATPDGWTVKTGAGKDAAVLYTCTNASGFICIGITPVSIVSEFIEDWRIPALKKDLKSGRNFQVQGSCFTALDKTTNWVAWGYVPPDETKDGARAVAEYHSYHIKNGYQIHICLIAPALEVKDRIKAFEFVRATYKTVEQTESTE